MLNLFSKDENIEKSAPIVGAEILKILNNKKSISIFSLVRELKVRKLIGVRSIYYGMIFLYALDLIEFNEPYLALKNDKN
ncbi:MAG: ABC-three component system middle component 6 [Rouxiella badensis]|uniref:ABC-three component system middle component 6 n=1 Tax=Rouxiella badensis TaxID=1646377 RepID=UPI003C40C21F